MPLSDALPLTGLKKRGLQAMAARGEILAPRFDSGRGLHAFLNQIAVLRKNTWSHFCDDIARDLETHTVAELALSQRAVSTLRDIYGKDAGRRGSKKFLAAVAEFNTKMGVANAPD